MNRIDMRNYSFIKPKDLNSKISDEDFYNVLEQLIPIYSTSDLMTEIGKLHGKDKHISMIGLGSFIYKGSYAFNYLPRNKTLTADIAYERGSQIKSDLMDYSFAIVDNKSANSFAVIDFGNSADNKYSNITDSSELSEKERKKLFSDIKQLSKQGITFPLSAIFYNRGNGSFRILDYTDVKIDGFLTSEEKENYIESYKKFLDL